MPSSDGDNDRLAGEAAARGGLADVDKLNLDSDMKFLLTNDDGVNAAGLRAVEHFLLRTGHDVFVAAPSGEQSGVSRSITFLTPLFATKAYDGPRLRGYAVDGTPVDCVKLALYELCPWRPDIVISGINGGLNAGINIHYSGTVGGAFEAAVSGILSFALSLEYQDEAPYDQAMSVLWPVMQPIIEQHRQASGERSSPLVELDRPPSSHLIYNINLPTIALRQSCPVSVVPMESRRNGIEFNSGHCPKNRRYYWATHDLLPEQPDPPTDVFALRQGHITVTPLEINMTCDAHLHRLRERLQGIERRSSGDGEHNTNAAPSGSRAPDDAGSAVGGPAAASDEETVDDGPRYSRL